jgi:hypothetical protein
VKLAKQWLGTWESEFGKDSILLAKCIPIEAGEGYYFFMEWKSNGVTYATGRCLMGFTQNNKSLVSYCQWPGGGLTKDIGNFVSETELIYERYLPDRVQPTAISKVVFPNTDSYKWELNNRGMQTTWEPIGTMKWTFNRVKE